MSELPRVASGRYVVRELIGRGGHSLIYRADDVRLGHTVAIKVLKDTIDDKDTYAQRLLREQLALTALKGTAAVRVHGVDSTEDGRVCLIMELLHGRDLDDELAALGENARVPLQRMIEWVKPIVDTLQVAHDIGIVHRDVKPGNIFVLERATGVRLLDFDLAHLQRERRITADGFVLGSPSYIPPEVWRGGAAKVDRRGDVYSLAAVIFRLLTGRVPFETDNVAEKRRMVLHDPRPSLSALCPELPGEVDEWVKRALAVERSDRYESVRDTWNALADFVDAPLSRPAPEVEEVVSSSQPPN